MPRSVRYALCVAGLVSLLAGATQGTTLAPHVEHFSPVGSAKQVRQVTARFTAPMVALGDPRLADPFDVSCSAPGKGRWADGRNWVYDFNADLPAGLRCSFTLKNDVKTLGNLTLSGNRKFAFDTGGPSIEASLPHEGSEDIDEAQVFLLRLDAAATAESVRQHAYCVVEGIAERVPVDVITGAARSALLAQRKQLGYAYYEVLWKQGEVSDVRVRDQTMQQAEALISVVKCLRNLPPATSVQLVWDAGIRAASGIATHGAQRLAYRVRAAFSARLTCTRTQPRAGCIPAQPITLAFSSPVPLAQALAVRLRIAANDMRAPDATVIKQSKTVDAITFKAPFPEGTNASLELPKQFTDDAGRNLENAARFPLPIRIDEYPPLVKFAADFGIIEAAEGGVLPVTVRNIDTPASGTNTTIAGKTLRVLPLPATITSWLQRVEDANRLRGEYVRKANAKNDNDTQWREETGADSIFSASDVTTTFALPKPTGAQPAEVIGIPLGGIPLGGIPLGGIPLGGIPLGKPGLYVVELQSRRLGAALLDRDTPRYVASAALVTNLAVHLKWGRESSRVWVTRLDNGAPVGAARVMVSAYCSGKVLWQGNTTRDGIATIDTSLGEPTGSIGCSEYNRNGIIATATVGDDTSFVLSNWDNGIAPHQFGLDTGSTYEIPIVHTVFDRALFRAGETVSMKHFLRKHVGRGMAIDFSAGMVTVLISHVGSDETYATQTRFGADGVGEQTWQIPKEAKHGRYEVTIKTGDDENRGSGEFRVEDFRLPTMTASVHGAARPLVRPQSATLDLHVGYIAGGSASGLAVKVRTLVEPAPLSHDGYRDFDFDGDAVREGVVINPDSDDDRDFSGGTAAAQAKTQVLPVILDAQGSARVTIKNLPVTDKPARLTAELEYADANGEQLTTTGRIRLVPAALSVGIRREGWVASSQQMRFRVVVLDLDGKPVAGRAVNATLYQAASYSYRKRLIGGFYTYESATENSKLAATCSGKTNVQGLLLCEVAPGVDGEVLVRAEARDANNQVAGATTSIWVVGKDEWWFGGTTGDRMDVLAEQPEYEVGQTARLQVRMPFRTATALVTVEREGVLKSFVTTLSGRAPIVEVPIDTAYSPNIFVSVLAVRGRVGGSSLAKKTTDDGREITALVDLNKPAYRLGTTALRVGWKPHRLEVRVTPTRTSYGIRDVAKIQIDVKRADGTALPAGAEIALAAVDEALLEIAPNESWKLLDAMMGTRGLEVLTSTAQMQVIGKRHYGRKAVPHGGGGGRERARQSFDTLLAWQGRVKLDARGHADISVPLNDSLTSFRIVAIAHAGAELFGTGSSNVVTTQELILLSGLPPLVREGDKYAATFTVRNTGTAKLPVTVSGALTPNAAGVLADQQIDIPAGGARDVTWTVTAPLDVPRLTWNVSVKKRTTPVGATPDEKKPSDQLKVEQVIMAAYPVRTYQATIVQLTAPLSIPAARPEQAIANRGGLEVALHARLGDGLDGVKEFMRDYPYDCFEQNVSRAVALHDKSLWNSTMARLPAYLDGDGLLKYFSAEWLSGDDTLTAYVLALADESGWAIPDVIRTRMLQGLTDFVAGKVTRYSALPTADLSVRKLAAINALARYSATQPHMLDSIIIEPNLWPTSALLDWLGILRRAPDIYRKGKTNNAALLDAARIVLRTRLNFQGTTMGFSTARNDALWWLMISEDSNAARLLLEVRDVPTWRDDIPRLARGLLGRQQRGHWRTTVANAWAVLAMQKFSAAFEATPVTGATVLRYGNQQSAVSYALTTTGNEKTAAKDQHFSWQNGTLPLTLTHTGSGRPWALVRATAALPLQAPFSSGYAIKRSVIAVEQQSPGHWTKGDVARVRLAIDAQADMTWVVVEDPIPGGATLLGGGQVGGLGGQSQLLAQGEQRAGWVWPAFEERTFDVFRAYYRYVPKGKFVVEYTVRLNNSGTFVLPATHVEAMYAPEMLGEIPNAPMIVTPVP